MIPLAQFFSRMLTAAPAFRGKGRLADQAAGVVRFLDGYRVRCAITPGAEMEFDLNDRIERAMWSGCWEPHVRNALGCLLRPGDAFLDAGAHIGYFTVQAASRVGPTGHVFAFEADPENFARLAQHAAAFPCVRVRHCALWERSGPLEFERPGPNGESGWGSVTAARVRGDGPRVRVEGVSLDDWLRKTQLTALRLMKLDAEGSEPAILRGAATLLAKLRPAIIIELNDEVLRQGGNSAEALAAQMIAAGYTLFALHALTVEPLANGATREVLALPAEHSDKMLAALRRGRVHS